MHATVMEAVDFQHGLVQIPAKHQTNKITIKQSLSNTYIQISLLMQTIYIMLLHYQCFNILCSTTLILVSA